MEVLTTMSVSLTVSPTEAQKIFVFSIDFDGTSSDWIAPIYTRHLSVTVPAAPAIIEHSDDLQRWTFAQEALTSGRYDFPIDPETPNRFYRVLIVQNP